MGHGGYDLLSTERGLSSLGSAKRHWHTAHQAGEALLSGGIPGHPCGGSTQSVEPERAMRMRRSSLRRCAADSNTLAASDWRAVVVRAASGEASCEPDAPASCADIRTGRG